MIENPGAARIRKLAQLARKKERLAQRKFLVEGPHATLEALQHTPETVATVFASDRALAAEPKLERLANTHGVRIERATEKVIAALSDTVTPQGVVAVVNIPEPVRLEELRQPRLVAVLHEVRDPGNAGTVIRVADAAGADAVILTGDSTDPWHPKVVRASTGSLFHIAVLQSHDLGATLETLRDRGLTTVAADLSGEDLSSADNTLQNPTAWVFGNEARGLDAHSVQLCDRAAKLPIYGKAESLNLATAAAVCLYTTAFAQRSAQPSR